MRALLVVKVGTTSTPAADLGKRVAAAAGLVGYYPRLFKA
jgi:hypothetical protein